MSFLNQLKSQAAALQREQSNQQKNLDENASLTEAACKRAWFYLSDLAKQLNVLKPPGPQLSLDGKTPWPEMVMADFRVDSRKKMLRNQEMYDHVGLWWRLIPRNGPVQTAAVSVNFPPDQQRVETRLSYGQVRHERKEVRHPEKNSLLAIRFEYLTESRGSVTLTPNHDRCEIAVRVVNTHGFEIINLTKTTQEFSPAALDELAKMVLDQPNRFTV